MDPSPLFYQAGPALPEVSHAKGVYLWDETGREYLDGCSGAISCNLGHGRSDIRDAMLAQLDRVAFTYRTQFENAPAVALAKALVGFTQQQLEKVFFVSSGSEAVESALKLARQYFVAKGEPQRRRFVSLRPSYHGSTLGALGVTGYQPWKRPSEISPSAHSRWPAPTSTATPTLTIGDMWNAFWPIPAPPWRPPAPTPSRPSYSSPWAAPVPAPACSTANTSRAFVSYAMSSAAC
ncbi:aminotransferase class III-fold pyridoxal phosphate-dependent enzyme [Halomonas sp. BC04]|uniref:aminotransferase class III-fold pyridoxal phosphate-dependent enzyme n=1 Tax=Halomonas sp. BC04 TaxID=1403540 RepID=UPI0003ED8462|nr:aminotransferase class III-fold pyridoxal phosphate-dependent enzyme [Halomonas sp. BC04]EWH00237.1 hypothetical protein Q427_20620 [Halomonas sp. BC04]